MAPVTGHPSIQSFYKREVQKNGETVPDSEPTKEGDGFTEEELADALDPLNRKWNPQREYYELNIDGLIPGPRAVTFVGRVVNVNTIFGRCPKQPKATGWHYVLLRDDSAAISLKLFFPTAPYPLKIGNLLTIWTVFISDANKAGTTIIPGVLSCANLFPGRVTSDHIMIHTTASSATICRTPLDYRAGSPLQGLMTLDSYLGSGHDGVVGAKLLVCIKSIGAKRRIQTKAGRDSDLVELWLFDHTGEIKWTVWNELIDSVREWEPGKTVLLITSPGYKVELSGKGSVGVQPSTMVDVDPEYPDAEWLRQYASGLTKKESIALEFPEGVWDVEGAEYGVNVILFTLAEIDEICGVAVYANDPTIPCPNCSKSLKLLLNPKIIGTLLDETGCIAPGKLLWSDRAWEQLLGRTVEEVTQMTADEVRWLEQRMLFMRMHLVVGWEENVGRLTVLGMRA